MEHVKDEDVLMLTQVLLSDWQVFVLLSLHSKQSAVILHMLLGKPSVYTGAGQRMKICPNIHEWLIP